MITHNTTTGRDPKKSPPDKPSWLSSFLPSKTTSRKPSHRPNKISTMLQILNPSGTPSHFPSKQPSDTERYISQRPTDGIPRDCQ